MNVGKLENEGVIRLINRYLNNGDPHRLEFLVDAYFSRRRLCGEGIPLFKCLLITCTEFQPQDISVYGSGEAMGTKTSIPYIHYRYCVNQNPNSLYTYTTSILSIYYV